MDPDLPVSGEAHLFVDALCPVQEELLRVRVGRVHRLEQRAGSQPACLIKEYSRPAAGLEATARDIRTIAALRRSVAHIRDRAGVGRDAYSFCWDRLRAVRQDLVMQRAGGPETAALLAALIRYHVFAAVQFASDPEFEAHLCRQQLHQYLLDLHAQPSGCASLPPLDAAVAVFLFYIDVPEAFTRLHTWLSANQICPRTNPLVAWAMTVSEAFRVGNFVRFHRLARGAPGWLWAGLVYLAFPLARSRALATLRAAFAGPTAKVKMSVVEAWLGCDATAAATICAQFGVQVDTAHVLPRRTEWTPPAPSSLERALSHGVAVPMWLQGLLRPPEKSADECARMVFGNLD